MHLVGFITRIYHDARSSECQILTDDYLLWSQWWGQLVLIEIKPQDVRWKYPNDWYATAIPCWLELMAILVTHWNTKQITTFFANMTPLGFGLVRYVNMKIVFFQDVTQHSSIYKYQRCIRTQNHHMHHRRWRHPSSSTTLLTMHQISWHHITEEIHTLLTVLVRMCQCVRAHTCV